MERFEVLRERLNALENSLQSFIEGVAGHIFPQIDWREELPQRLRIAIQEGCRTLADGRIIAPNVIRIAAAPASAAKLRQEDGFILDLQTQLETIARQAGLDFLDSPVIQIVDDPLLPLEQIMVEAEFQGKEAISTFALEPEIGESQVDIPPNAFLIINGVRIYSLDRAVINIGRHPDNHIVLNDPKISRQHAQLRAVNGKYILFDLGSTAGTLVNNQRIHQAILSPGDVISLAGYPLVYGQDTIGVGSTQKTPWQDREQ